MSLWRRAPREVYRVYGEDEYIAGGEAPGWEEPGPVPLEAGAPATDQPDTLYEHDTRASQAYGPRSRRIGGLALLVAVTVTVFGLVAANALRRPRAAPPARVAQAARAGLQAPAPAVARSPRGGSPESRASAGTFRLPHAVAPAKAVPRVQARAVAEPQAQAPEAPAPEVRVSRAPTSQVDGEFGFER